MKLSFRPSRPISRYRRDLRSATYAQTRNRNKQLPFSLTLPQGARAEILAGWRRAGRPSARSGGPYTGRGCEHAWAARRQDPR